MNDKALQGEVIPREAPEQRIQTIKDIILPVLNEKQMEATLLPTPEWAKKKRVGLGGKTFTYVPHGYVTDALNKIFGFDWDISILPMSDGKMYALEVENLEIVKNGKSEIKTIRHIAVCGRLAVRIRNEGKIVATITKDGFGSQTWLPTMELGDALKAARSDLLKTCAYQLGIALDLYWNEQAELSLHEEKQRKLEEERKQVEELTSAMTTGVPSNPALLLSRALSDYGLDAVAIEVKLGKQLPEILTMNAEDVKLAWHILSNEEAKNGDRQKDQASKGS